MSKSERWAARGLLAAGLLLLPGSLVAQLAVEPVDESRQERHELKEGETLSQLAERYLGSAEAWPKLWSYNPEITNPHWIYPGGVVRLKEGVDLGSAATVAAAGGVGGAPGNLRFANRRTPRVGAGVIRVGEEVYLDRDALKSAARIVGSSEDHMLLSPSDQAYVQFADKEQRPAPGKELTVFVRLHKSEIRARAAKQHVYRAGEVGEVVRVLGALRVIDFDAERKMARVVVIEALEPIERGFEVADVPRVLPEVAPKPNAQQLDAKIVAATRALGTLAEGQLVFLDVGGKQGVEVGNRFWVIRQGDTWRQNLLMREPRTGAARPDPTPLPDSAFPPEAVAELRVVFLRPDSATAFITSSRVEVGPGDRVEMRKGY
jgi:hypothetical protein